MSPSDSPTAPLDDPAPQGVADDDGAAAVLVAAAATSVPAVVGLDAGAFGEVGTYLPGRRVAGVRLRGDRTEVHVVLAYGSPLRESALAVQRAVGAVRSGPVDVVVEDVARPPSSSPSISGDMS